MCIRDSGTPKYPAIGSVQNLFSTGAPQLYANLNRERCKDMGVSVSATMPESTTDTEMVIDVYKRQGIGWEVVIKPDYRPGGRIIGREIAFGFQWFHGRPAKANPNKRSLLHGPSALPQSNFTLKFVEFQS